MKEDRQGWEGRGRSNGKLARGCEASQTVALGCCGGVSGECMRVAVVAVIREVAPGSMSQRFAGDAAGVGCSL